MTCRYPSTDVAHENIAGYIEHAREILTTIARQGSYPFAGHLSSQSAAA